MWPKAGHAPKHQATTKTAGPSTTKANASARNMKAAATAAKVGSTKGTKAKIKTITPASNRKLLQKIKREQSKVLLMAPPPAPSPNKRKKKKVKIRAVD